MAKNDKDFGEWQGTTCLNNKRYIKRFEKGFIIKDRGSQITERIQYPNGTTRKDMTDMVNEYYA